MVIDTIAERIKQRRLALGLSLQEVAYCMGLSKSTLQRYESGNIRSIPLQQLEPLAKALHTSPDWLLGWNDEAEKPGLIDQSFKTLLFNLGYDLQIYSSGKKINLRSYTCGGPITEAEYMQLRDSIYAYIRFNTENLIKMASERDAKRIEDEKNQLEYYLSTIQKNSKT